MHKSVRLSGQVLVVALVSSDVGVVSASIVGACAMDAATVEIAQMNIIVVSNVT